MNPEQNVVRIKRFYSRHNVTKIYLHALTSTNNCLAPDHVMALLCLRLRRATTGDDGFTGNSMHVHKHQTHGDVHIPIVRYLFISSRHVLKKENKENTVTD